MFAHMCQLETAERLLFFQQIAKRWTYTNKRWHGWKPLYDPVDEHTILIDNIKSEDYLNLGQSRPKQKAYFKEYVICYLTALQ